MRQKVAVVTDSLACLPRELARHSKIEIAPLNFHFHGKVYKDWIDITPSEAHELFLQDPRSWRSSGPSPVDFLDAYRRASKIAPNILCITVSNKLSDTTFASACVAREDAATELPSLLIRILDSRTTTAAQGFVALGAARAAIAGKDFDEVTKIAETIRDNVSFITFLDTIRYVFRSGRIPRAAAHVGSLINIKPILTVSSGTVHFAGMVRGKTAGVNRLIDMTRRKIGENPVHVAIMHVNAPEEASKLRERFLTEFDCPEIWITEFSPLMSYTCGEGALGLAFYQDERAEFAR